MATNNVLPSRLFHAKLSNSEAAIPVINDDSDAVPAGKRYMVTCLTVVNNGTSDETVLIRFVPSGETPGDEHNIISGQTQSKIKAGQTALFLGRWILHAGDTVRGKGGTSNKVTIRGDGGIVTVS